MRHSLIFLCCALASSQALAFKAKVSSTESQNVNDRQSAVTPYSGFHEMITVALTPGSCSAEPVNGCHCALCSQLRR